MPRYYLRMERSNYSLEPAIFITHGAKNSYSYDGGIYDGRGVAHDICEHVYGISQIGTIEDEIRAFGAIAAIRVETGYMFGQGGYYPPEQQLGIEIAEFTRRELQPTRLPKGHALFSDPILEMAAEYAHKNNPEVPKEDYYRYLAQGYEKAHQRYQEGGVYMALETYRGIEECVDREIAHGFHEPENARWQLDVDFITATVNLKRTDYWGKRL